MAALKAEGSWHLKETAPIGQSQSDTVCSCLLVLLKLGCLSTTVLQTKHAFCVTVITIDLGNNRLTGTLPSFWSVLTQVTFPLLL